MDLFFSRAWTTVIVVGLAAFVFLKGIVPAMSEITADFPGYFTAARIVIDGQDTQRLYDDSWFREQIRRYGLEGKNPGKFAPFPPPTALLLVPLARCEPLTALSIVTVVSVLCLVCSIFMLATSCVESGRFGTVHLVVRSGHYRRIAFRPALHSHLDVLHSRILSAPQTQTLAGWCLPRSFRTDQIFSRDLPCLLCVPEKNGKC